MRARRLAAIADLHGNAVVLALPQPDAVVHCGHLTWGPMPAATADPVGPHGDLFVPGHGDRAVGELAERLADPGADATPRERWMVSKHNAGHRELLAAFPEFG